MKITVDVPEETAERIQALPDPGKDLEEALRWKEYHDWQKSRATPKIQSLINGAMEKAESMKGLGRDELFDRLEAVVDRIEKRCQS